MKKLTIGMCVYDDFDGVYFTIQSIRMHHKEVIDDIEFVVINNNPNSVAGEMVKEFILNTTTIPVKYAEFTQYSGTSLRNNIFDVVETPYVLVTDCHVLFESGSLKRLIDFYDAGLDDGNLLQGPLLHDTLDAVSTHMDAEWRDSAYGIWGTDPLYVNSDSAPFEIKGQGLGVFSCRTDSWLGFNPNFRGFGGEELYIHMKYILSGKKTLCLPFLGWCHRFGRAEVPYPNTSIDRYRNYLIGRIELGLDFDDVESEFAPTTTQEERDMVHDDILGIFNEELTISGGSDGGCACGK